MKKLAFCAALLITSTATTAEVSSDYKSELMKTVKSRFGQLNSSHEKINVDFENITFKDYAEWSNVALQNVTIDMRPLDMGPAEGNILEERIETIRIGEFEFTDGLQNEDIALVPSKGMVGLNNIQVPVSAFLYPSTTDSQVKFLTEIAGEDDAINVDVRYTYDIDQDGDITVSTFYASVEKIGAVTADMTVAGLIAASKANNNESNPNASMVAAQNIGISPISVTFETEDLSYLIDSVATMAGNSTVEELAALMKAKKSIDALGDARTELSILGADLINTVLVAYSQGKNAEVTIDVNEPITFMSILQVVPLQGDPDAIIDLLGINVDFAIK